MEELLFGNSKSAEPVPSVPWESMRDNPTDERPGWNFLKDHRTRMPVDGEKWLFERVGRTPGVRDRFMKPGTRSGLNRAEVERYMGRIIEFREKLTVLMHMTGGQPARWPEILSVRHSNTVKGGHPQHIHRRRHGGIGHAVPQRIQQSAATSRLSTDICHARWAN